MTGENKHLILYMKKLLTLALMLMVVCGAMAQEGTKKFAIKSGMAKTTTEVMGQTQQVTLYFDNYGALQCSKTKATVPGMGDLEMATIIKDGKTWMVNYTMKQVQEIPAEAQEDIDFNNLTEEIKTKYNVREAGTEELLGKTCTKYTYEAVIQGQKAKGSAWVYKGFPLKSVVSVAGMEIKSEVTEFLESILVMPQTFDIPKF